MAGYIVTIASDGKLEHNPVADYAVICATLTAIFPLRRAMNGGSTVGCDERVR